VINKTEIVR